MKLLKKIKNKLFHYFRKSAEPPSYEFKRSQIEKYRIMYGTKVLVETGTFLGDTVNFFKDYFDKIISIELAKELAENAKKRFANDDNVTIIEGDSSEVLTDILKEIREPVLFWLDGHYSSEFFMGDVFIRTARGKKDTPVQEELKIIFESGIDHIILIDDARLFTGQSDYPTIKKLKQSVKKYNQKYSVHVDTDIIYILPQTV